MFFDRKRQVLQGGKIPVKEVKMFNFKDKLIFTSYYALHDKSGTYKGILEVSQDITRFKNLKGERKLLNWD